MTSQATEDVAEVKIIISDDVSHILLENVGYVLQEIHWERSLRRHKNWHAVAAHHHRRELAWAFSSKTKRCDDLSDATDSNLLTSRVICVGKKKALVLGGVPEKLTSKLAAGKWVQIALEPLGGKCGPNPKLSQGQGPQFENIEAALEAATAYAQAQLVGWT